MEWFNISIQPNKFFKISFCVLEICRIFAPLNLINNEKHLSFGGT